MTVSTRVGLGLLLLVFGWSGLRQIKRATADVTDDRVVVRVAHRFLHEGIRNGLAEIARNYEREHPDVRIEYLEVPQNLWESWITTRLLGENAPELINSGHLTDEQTSRFLEPLTSYLGEPNPANADTDIAGVQWRDTFVNGLNDNYNFHSRLMEYYAVPTSFNTRRFFYNRDQFRHYFGTEAAPETFAELLSLCERLVVAGNENEATPAPVASSLLHSRWLLSLVVQHFTQNLAQDIDVYQSANGSLLEAMIALSKNDWQPADGAMREAWLAYRELCQYFQPGFLAADREQATLLFMQGRAAMLFSASWDAQMVFATAPFEVGVFALPLPEVSVTDSAPLRPVSETNVALGGSFSVVRTAPNWEHGLDFLHYLTSQTQNQVFANHSYRLPSVLGVEPAADVLGFTPRVEGAPPGINIDDLPSFGAGMSQLVVDRNLHRLIESGGDADGFFEVLTEEFPAATRQDLQRYATRLRDVIARQEVLYFARSVIAGNRDTSLSTLREQIDRQVLTLTRIEGALSQP